MKRAKAPVASKARTSRRPIAVAAPITAKTLIAMDAAVARQAEAAVVDGQPPAVAPAEPAPPILEAVAAAAAVAGAPAPDPATAEPSPRAQAPEPAAETDEEAADEAWRNYKRGEIDDEGGVIEEIFVRAKSYVIYQTDGHVNFQGEEASIDRADEVADLLHMVSILRPSNPAANLAVNQQIARGIDLCLGGRLEASKLLFKAIIQQLEQAALAGQRLFYFLAATVSATVVWVVYLVLHSGGSGKWMPPGWEPWLLAASLGAVGGLLSVCMRLGTIAIYPSQAWYVTFWAGVTRILIALLGGCACLLAIRSKVIMGIASGDGASSALPLVLAEMFFCFLAGFSETFVANIFRQGEDDAFQQAKQAAKKPAQ